MKHGGAAMRLLEFLYRSPIGRLMSLAARIYSKLQRPFMVYGYYDHKSGRFRKFTRMSNTVVIMNKKHLVVGDNVWVWHYSILDATEGLIIEEGCQIGAWVGVFTHGSEASIRLLGRQFINIPNTERRGYTRGTVRIGAYSFVGAGSVILPGVTIGKGCLIGTGALVTKDVPDYSIVVGCPGQVRGSTIDLDMKYFASHDFSDTYYDATALEMIKRKMPKTADGARESIE
jgi:acetyltransferase-like isoleucine patch superfamily enzyme